MNSKMIKIMGLTMAISLCAALPVLAGGRPAGIPAFVMAQLQRTCQELQVPARQLRGLGDVQALLSSPHGRIRAMAAYTLGESHDPRAVKPLLGMLNDQDYHVRRIAVTALGKLGDSRAVEGLVALLKSNQPVSVQVAVMEALARIGGERSLTVVASYTDAESGWLRHAALKAKKKLAPYQRDMAKR